MLTFPAPLHRRTPHVTALDNRGHAVRDIRYHRHPGTPDLTDERINRHKYDVRGHLVNSTDPRLYEAMQKPGSEVKANFRYNSALSGSTLKTESTDAGTAFLLTDSAGRPVARRNAEGVITGWQYEGEGAGRLLYITEKSPNGKENTAERFVYAENTSENRAYNLVGSLITHYDTAGVKCTKSISLNGIMLSVTQQLLNDDEDRPAECIFKKTS